MKNCSVMYTRVKMAASLCLKRCVDGLEAVSVSVCLVELLDRLGYTHEALG